MPPRLLVVSLDDTISPADAALVKLAAFHGLATEKLVLDPDSRDLVSILSSGGRAVAMEYSTYRALARREFPFDVLHRFRFILLYGFGAAAGSPSELGELTDGAVSSVKSLAAGPRHVEVRGDVKFAAFSVSGRSCCLDMGPTLVFSPSMQRGHAEPYITIDGSASLLVLPRGESTLFLLADSNLIDLDEALPRGASLRPWYTQIIAVTIFLRVAFGPWCWTAPLLGATFIIDDPYLKPRYGFLQFESLLAELQACGGAVSIAFIPYNYRRTVQRVAAALQRNSARFSLAIHGCDHTGGEFASHDMAWLGHLGHCATQRMIAHERQTELGFDNIMVFPQGRFSTAAARALKDAGFTAAVNSTPWPEDCDGASLSVRDVLDVAITRYHSFPIFLRRYPLDVFDFAFDALFQKPILLVEHHRFFRAGYAPLADTVRRISTLATNVSWMPLGHSLVSSYLLRRDTEHSYVVRHFCPILHLKNPIGAETSLRIEKPEADGVVEAVLVNGTKAAFQIESGVLRYVAHLKVGEELDARVLYRNPSPVRQKVSYKYRCTTGLRRLACDIRDDYLSRSDFALTFTELLVQRFRKVAASD